MSERGPIPDWQAVGMGFAETIARKSRCSSKQVGAAIASSDFRHWAMGYNGPPAGFDHEGVGCRFWCMQGAGQDDGFCPSVHAEINAIAQSDRRDREGGTFFVTAYPCWKCALAVLNSGVHHLVCPDWPAGMRDLRDRVHDMAYDSGVSITLTTTERA